VLPLTGNLMGNSVNARMPWSLTRFFSRSREDSNLR
jgi:hypothetical protein